jgi:glycosyltransferase involved in cell wall biosynthesis
VPGGLFLQAMSFSNWPGYMFIAFSAVVLLQLFYYWFFFSRLSFYRSRPAAASQAHPVSVIVCARDESRNLLKNLPGILAQQYPYTHELVIVNDNSYDDSAYVLEQFQKEFRHINVVSLTDLVKAVPGKKFPLSIGIKAAKYELLLLTDADCVPASPLWMEKMQQAFGGEVELVLGYGAYKKRKGLLNKIIRFETFHTALQYLSYALAGQPYMGVGRNLAYRRDLFFRNKGFAAHNKIPGGDDDLFVNQVATKQNTKVVIDPDTFTYSTPKTSWGAWYRQKTRHFGTGRYYKTRHRFLLGLYAVLQLAVYPLFVLSLLFFNWQLALGVFGLRLLSLMITWFGAMNRLHEKDLKPWFLFFDIWMSLYFIIFAPATWKKIKPGWS